MKTNLETLQEIDSQVSEVRRLIKNQEYIGAGVNVDLYLGQNTSIAKDIVFGVITDGAEELLDLICANLEQRRKYYLKELNKEFNIIKKYLDEKK